MWLRLGIQSLLPMEFHHAGRTPTLLNETHTQTFLLQRRVEEIRARLGFGDSSPATVSDEADPRNGAVILQRPTYKHKDTERQRHRENAALKICYLRRFLCAFVSLCLCAFNALAN